MEGMEGGVKGVDVDVVKSVEVVGSRGMASV